MVMNLDEIKAIYETKVAVYKSQVLFDQNSSYMRDLEVILKLCNALDKATTCLCDIQEYCDDSESENGDRARECMKEIEEFLK
jgi:hypothetical protein